MKSVCFASIGYGVVVILRRLLSTNSCHQCRGRGRSDGVFATVRRKARHVRHFTIVGRLPDGLICCGFEWLDAEPRR